MLVILRDITFCSCQVSSQVRFDSVFIDTSSRRRGRWKSIPIVHCNTRGMCLFAREGWLEQLLISSGLPYASLAIDLFTRTWK